MEEKPEPINDFFNTCGLCGVHGLERWAVKVSEEGLVVCRNESYCHRQYAERLLRFRQSAEHDFGRENVIDFGFGLVILKGRNKCDAGNLKSVLVTHIFEEFCRNKGLKPQKSSLEAFSAASDHRLLSLGLGQSAVDDILKKYIDQADGRKENQKKSSPKKQATSG